MEEFTVSRSGVRMWLLALAGVPMVVIGIDLLMRRRIFGAISAIVFLGDPQLVEPRDVIWAGVLLALGVIFIGFGLRELVAPKPVLAADASGLHLHLGHPLSRSITVPWGEIDAIGAEELDDDGSVIPVMWVRVSNPARLPANPWGARWIEPDTIAVMGADWERTPQAAAQAAARFAEAVRRAEERQGASVNESQEGS